MSPSLPVGNKPGWEIHQDSEDGQSPELKSIPQSYVILQSLKESRERLLTIFKKFSTTSRGGKPSDIIPPPHTLHNRGKCDLEIGPHIFPSTTIYEIRYQPAQPPVPRTAYAYSTALANTAAWQTTTPYIPYAQQPAAVANHLSTISSSVPTTILTPALIDRVNSAAISNPTLSNLLQLAAAGHATPEQLKTLGLLIQSLSIASQADQAAANAVAAESASLDAATSMNTVPRTSGPAYTTGYYYIPTSSAPPLKQFDLVMEFQETASQKWVFPRGPVVCEQQQRAGQGSVSACDIVLSTCFPYEEDTRTMVTTDPLSNTSNVPKAVRPEIISIRFLQASHSVWDTIFRWAGGQEKMQQNRCALERIANSSKRAYLGYQLSEGPLLTQIQMAAAPPLNTKLIRPGAAPNPRQRRKAIPRKPPAGATTASNDSPGSIAPKTPAPKRRRVSQAKSSVPNPIACQTCGQTDVPLIRGGRFCRRCVEDGKANVEIPQVPKFPTHSANKAALKSANPGSGSQPSQSNTSQVLPPPAPVASTVSVFSEQATINPTVD